MVTRLHNHAFVANSATSDSKSSSGTQSSRPYNNGQFGSTSTLPSSADADSNDNIFAVPRPHPSHYNSSPNVLGLGPNKKQLPPLPKSSTMAYGEPTSPDGFGRMRAMTSSSYASTAKPPTLDADMNFGSTSFDDMFSGLDRKETRDDLPAAPGRSLLAEKRTFQAEPIKIDHKPLVEAPLKSWDSRGSNDNLISRSPDSDSPPPVPPHKYSKYAPVASHSPGLDGRGGFEQKEKKPLQQSTAARKSDHESSPERHPNSQTSSSATSLQTPLSSRSASNNTTPKAALRGGAGPAANDEDDDNLFAPSKQQDAPAPKPAAPAPKPARPTPSVGGATGQRVMSQAEFRDYQQRQTAEKHDASSDEEDYEDEEDAEERAQQEAIARRRAQKMDMARASMIRSTTAPARPDSVTEPHTAGFPSEVSMKADEWEDEDIPLGILAQHGFPNSSRGKLPTQPANPIPSYWAGQPVLPERPASAGAMSNRQSQAFRPAFARNLPDDPFANPVIGGGLIRPSVRESMGFNRGPASVAGDPTGGMGMPMGYPEPQMSAPSLVDQIHMRDMSKQKYMGGASSKKPTPQGPFTGMLGAQMNGPSRTNPQTRMSMAGGMNGMAGPNGMPMMNNPNMMGAPMGMPMMGMGGMGAMGYMTPEMMQMQQQMWMQQQMQFEQMQFAQMQAMNQQGQQQGANPRMSMVQDPRLSMAQDPRMSMSMGNFGNSFLNVPGPQRPMSMQQQGRPFSTGQMGSFQPAAAGYTPSIAPSERSNIGLSARYRPVATHQDAKSSVSNNTTLQASGGATQSSQGTVKGILKHKSSTPVPVLEEEEEGWGKIASRKSKYAGSNSKNDNGLRELTQGMDRL
jgi:hypothetical protein